MQKQIRTMFIAAALLLTVPAYAQNGIAIDSFPEPVIQQRASNEVIIKETTNKPIPPYNEIFVNLLLSRIYQNWDPPENCRQKLFRVCFEIDSKGRFNKIRIANPSEDEQVNFSVIEAVSKSSGCGHVPESIAGVEITLNRDLVKQKHPECRK